MMNKRNNTRPSFSRHSGYSSAKSNTRQKSQNGTGKTRNIPTQPNSPRSFSHSYPSDRQQFPFKLVAFVVAILALIIAITIGVQSCGERSYDWNNLVNENGRYSYVENGATKSLTGIDVSSHQGSINWSEVTQDDIDFAILRCARRGTSEGQIYADETFYTNADGAQQAGIPFGVYFFSQAINEDEAREEAQYVLNMIEGMQVDGPIAYDFEYLPNTTSRADGLNAEQVSANAEAFCSTIEAAGYTALIYGNQHDLERYDLDTLRHKIWYAEYSSSQPSSDVNLVMWQYTASGSVSGISTAVDLNILLDPSLVN